MNSQALSDEGDQEFKKLVEIMARLRSPSGCPWDREQSHESLKKYAVEETYELLDAIDSGADSRIREELGDLLLQVVFHAQLASERSSFNVADVIRSISEKLIERHPHVFGDVKVSGVDEVLSNWEDLKLEKSGRKRDGGRGILDGVPRSLPALLMVYRIAEKLGKTHHGAGHRGRDLPASGADTIEETALIDKIRATPIERDNLGDLLFDVALLAVEWGMDPEEELRKRNHQWIDEVTR